MSIQKTGVYATDEERRRAIELSQKAANAPIARVHGVWLLDASQAALESGINMMAYAHGLPVLRLADGNVNNYGMTAAGEFTTWLEESGGEHE